MDRRQIGLKLALDALGDAWEFRTKGELHWVVYILQECGVKLGYKFWWGDIVFAPELPDDYAAAKDCSQNDLQGWIFLDWHYDAIGRAKAVLEKVREKPEPAEELSLLVDYLFRRERFPAMKREPEYEAYGL